MIELQGHEGLYLERDTSSVSGIGFDKKIYIMYPEYWQIVEMFVGEDVTKEEAMKVAENLKISTTDEMQAVKDAPTWSTRFSENIEGDMAADSPTITVPAEDMQNIHQIGDTFPITGLLDLEKTDDQNLVYLDCLNATVTEVTVADDTSLVADDPDMDSALTGADGKLVPNKIEYINAGDGVHRLDDVIWSEEVPQKLVYVTVEYTNTGDTELKEVLYFAQFVGLEQKDGSYQLYDRAKADEYEETNVALCKSKGGFGEIDYYSPRSGSRNNNYITSIRPHESVKVHVAKIVNEDELDKMYLSLYTSGEGSQLGEKAVKEGYIDIRQ